MKKLIFLSILTFGISAVSFAQNCGWTDISANIPGTPDLSDVFFVSDNKGWITSSSHAEIYHTENGWNWSEQINPDTHTLYDVFFLNTNEGWAVGLGSQILHTANGGNNWTINIFGDIQLNAVHFTSTTNGYVVGNSKTLLKYGEILGTGNAIVETLQFDIFPNPTKNKFEIMSSEFATKNCTIKLHDLHGKTLLVKQIATGHEKVEIDVSNLSSGVYFCTLSTDKKNSTKKLIIE